jgi:hypothetical protein
MEVLQKQGISAAQYKTKNFQRKLSSSRRKGSNSGLSVPPEIETAIATVRADSTPNNWALVRYANMDCTSLELVGSGEGGISELAQELPESDVAYGVIRETFMVRHGAHT